MRRFSGVASLLFASAAACGKTVSLSDAPTHDGSSTDANTTADATPTGDVTVITKSRCCTDAPGTLESDVAVFSVQPDGNAGPMGLTDSNGKVVLTGVLQGASITAVYSLDSTDYQLVTVLAVKPGDTITLGDDYTAQLPAGSGVLTVNFPTYPNATLYTAYAPCDNIGSTVSPITITENCTLATANILLFARDATGAILATGYLKGVAYTDGSTATLTAWIAAPAGGFTTSITGLIDDVNEFDVDANLEADGTASWNGNGYVSPVTGNAAAVNFPLPIGGDRTYVQGTLYRGTNGFGQQQMFANVGPTATSVAFPPPTLPWVSQVLVDPSGGDASWIQVGGTKYDAAFVHVGWNRPDVANDATDYYNWNILIPPGVTSFQWGTPIAALAPYLPVATDNLNNSSLQLIDLADAADYDATRAVPEWQWNDPGYVTQTGEVTGVSAIAFPFNGGEGFAPPHHHAAARKR